MNRWMIITNDDRQIEVSADTKEEAEMIASRRCREGEFPLNTTLI